MDRLINGKTVDAVDQWYHLSVAVVAMLTLAVHKMHRDYILQFDRVAT